MIIKHDIYTFYSKGGFHPYVTLKKLDESPGHYLVDVIHTPDLGYQMAIVMIMNDLLTPLCAMSIGPLILRYSYTKIWPWKLMVKVMCVVKSQGHVWPSKVKVMVMFMVKFKPIGHIWGLEFNRYVCFSFRGNRTTFGWDIGNSIFDLENSRSMSWPRSKSMVTLEP